MAKNNKTRFFYVLSSDKTRAFHQSERAQGPIYIINGLINAGAYNRNKKPVSQRFTAAHVVEIGF